MRWGAVLGQGSAALSHVPENHLLLFQQEEDLLVLLLKLFCRTNGETTKLVWSCGSQEDQEMSTTLWWLREGPRQEVLSILSTGLPLYLVKLPWVLLCEAAAFLMELLCTLSVLPSCFSLHHTLTWVPRSCNRLNYRT